MCHIVRYCTVSMATALSRTRRDSRSASGKRWRRESRARFLSRISLRRTRGRRVRFAGRERKTFRQMRGEAIRSAFPLRCTNRTVPFASFARHDVSTIDHRLAKNGDVVLEKNEEQKLVEEAANASALVINSLFLALLFSFSLSHSLSHFFLLWIYKPRVHRIELHRVEFH